MAILKARDVVDKLRGHVDPRVIEVVAAIAEENHEIKKVVTELTLIVDQLCEMMPSIANVMSNMKSSLDGLKKAEDDDLPPLSGDHLVS